MIARRRAGKVFSKFAKKKLFKKKGGKRKKTKPSKFGRYKKSYRKKQFKKFRKRKRVFKPAETDYRQEFGGTFTAATASLTAANRQIFLGHSVGGTDVLDVVITHIVKRLMARYGVYYESDQDLVLDATAAANNPYYVMSINWRYQYSDAAINNTDYNITTNKNVHDYGVALAGQLRTDMLTTINNTRLGAYHLVDIRLFSGALQGAKDNLLAQLELSRMVLDISFESKLRIQNKTKTDDDATGLTGTDELNVNPLQAKLYIGKVGRNYIKMRPENYNDTSTPAPAFRGWCPSGVGLIRDRADTHATNNFNMLPTKKDVDVADIRSFVIHPGQVMEDKLYYKVKINLNTFFRNIWQAVTSNDTKPVELGRAHVFGFDKLLWDRNTNESPVSIGFQVQSRFKVSSSIKKINSAPYVNVNISAVNPAAW